MHLAVIEYEPKRRLTLHTPRLLRNSGILLLIVGVGMALFLPFAAGVMFLVSLYTTVIDKHETIVIWAGAALTGPYLLVTAGVILLGMWAFRRRREVEIDASLGAVIEREQFVRSVLERRFLLSDLAKATCMARLKSAGEGRRGGSLTSYAVNLVFQDGSVVNFECLDSRLPAMIEQVVPNLQSM